MVVSPVYYMPIPLPGQELTCKLPTACHSGQSVAEPRNLRCHPSEGWDPGDGGEVSDIGRRGRMPWMLNQAPNGGGKSMTQRVGCAIFCNDE